jgi:GNAT superfamily N-acetyltransferase
MLGFTPFDQHPRGTIVSLLVESYAGYFEIDPGCEDAWRPGWVEYERQVFDHPDTVGVCGFVTCLREQEACPDERVVGFASLDPRGFPAVGIIGHNCILPAFRGNSYGKAQVSEVLRRLNEKGFRKAAVTTGEHAFFAPAQRMYLACGFCEVRRGFSDLYSRFRTIDYELELG